MRVKPYAIRFPSRNARHTARSAPGGRMSTYGSPDGTAQASGPAPAARGNPVHPPVSLSGKRSAQRLPEITCYPPPPWPSAPSALIDVPARMTNPVPPSHLQPLPDSTSRTTGLLATHERWSGCSRRNRTQASPPSCRRADVPHARIYAQSCINFHDPASAHTSQRQLLRTLSCTCVSHVHRPRTPVLPIPCVP